MNQITQKIDFNKISEETGVRKGKIFHSPTFKSWVISGHPDIDLICIKAPYNIGDKINDMTVQKVRIENNHWVFEVHC